MKNSVANPDFTDLRRKIHEQYPTDKAFAAAIGMNNTQLSRRLQGVARFRAEEIRRIAGVLAIPDEEIETTFFADNREGGEAHG